jgi:hypothetical protein
VHTNALRASGVTQPLRADRSLGDGRLGVVDNPELVANRNARQ